jgi:hypothetical protein
MTASLCHQSFGAVTGGFGGGTTFLIGLVDLR